MERRVLWFAAALLTAQTASAQIPGGGGMGGMGGGRRGGMGGMGGMSGGMERVGRAQNMKFPSAKALQDYNPASLLLDKHKKLKLTDAQQEQMKALRFMIFERNATLLARYDSLQRDYKPPQLGGGALGGGDFGGGMGGRGGARGGGRGEGGEGGQGRQDPAADSTRREAMRQMMQLRQLADSLEDRRRTDVRDVLSALSDDAQKKKAAEFLDKQDIEFAKEFPAPPQQRSGRDPRAAPPSE
jgi:hypothetical protein